VPPPSRRAGRIAADMAGWLTFTKKLTREASMMESPRDFEAGDRVRYIEGTMS